MPLLFQPVDVVYLDLLLQHVVQVEHALVNLTFQETSAPPAKQDIMTIQTATVSKLINFLSKFAEPFVPACDSYSSGSTSTSYCTCVGNAVFKCKQFIFSSL